MRSLRHVVMVLTILLMFGGWASAPLHAQQVGSAEAASSNEQQTQASPEGDPPAPTQREAPDADSEAVAAQAQQDQREAHRQRERALHEVQTAESGAARLVASRRASLLALKARQAEYRGVLAGQMQEPNKILDAALGAREKVNAISAARIPADAKKQQADALYRQLVEELQHVRQRLGAALDENPSQISEGLRPQPFDDAVIEQADGGPELRKLRMELMHNADVLESKTTEMVWKKRSVLEDAMVILNDSRLDLIGHLTPAMRRKMVGFGEEGTAQFWREVVQITLVARYNLQGYGRRVATIAESLFSSSPVLVLILLELLAVIALFRFWRAQGDAILARSEARARDKRPPTLLSSLQAKLFVYIRRIKTPLDWFVFVQIVRWILPDEYRLPGFEFLWIILSWLLGAAVLIRLIDEFAKGGRRFDPRADLRWKSLRLIGGLTVGVGMILRLTSTLVGKGAIYSWVLSACWVLVPLVALILVRWWRARIVELSVEGADDSALLSWNAQNPNGIAGLAGRILAGAYLLVQGAFRIMVRQSRRIALIRDIHGQHSREQVARQEADLLSSGLYERPDDAVMAALKPDLHAPDAYLASAWPADIATFLPAASTLSAIVGDRGSGKSALLMEQGNAMDAAGIDRIHVTVGVNGLAGVLRALTTSLGGKPADEPSIAGVLERMGTSTGEIQISLDDVQRLVEPSIGGLKEFDALVRMARAAPPNFRWLFVIGRPAWTFLSRARFDRLIFDRVLRVPRWDYAMLRTLLEERTKAAGIKPDYSELQDEGAFIFESDMSPQDRRNRTYFESLFEYAGGNPAVALEFWRKSLFVKKATGQIVVHTFAAPNPGKITVLPDAALFALRTIIQMDGTSEAAIRRCTDLSPVIISDVLRSLVRIGVLEHTEDGEFRVAMLWWREVVELLERRNLIVAEART